MRFPLLFLIPVSLALYTCTRADAQGLDLLGLTVDRNDGKGFVPLAYETTPNYEDTAPIPAIPTKWTYKAIYRVGDHQVGQWSGEVSVVVGGLVSDISPDDGCGGRGLDLNNRSAIPHSHLSQFDSSLRNIHRINSLPSN